MPLAFGRNKREMLVVLQENKTEHRLTWLLGAHLSFHMEGETCSLSEPTIWHFCVNTGSKNPATVEDERKLFSVWLGAGPRMAHHFRKAHSWWQNPFGAWVTEIPPVSAACICGYVFKVPPSLASLLHLFIRRIRRRGGAHMHVDVEKNLQV